MSAKFVRSTFRASSHGKWQNLYVGDCDVSAALAIAGPTPLSLEAVQLARKFAQLNDVGWPIGLDRHIHDRKIFLFEPDTAAHELKSCFGISYISATQRKPYPEAYRPELAAIYLLKNQDAMSVPALLHLSSLVGGTPEIRRAGHFTTPYPSGQRIEFLKRPYVDKRLDQLFVSLKKPTWHVDPLINAIGAMLDFLLIHPLRDGNGRVARLFFQHTLLNALGVEPPLLPLAPYIDAKKSAFLYACLRLELMCDPEPIVTFMASAVSETAKAVSIICKEELYRADH